MFGKKTLCLLLALAMAFTLAACGGSGSASAAAPASQPTAQSQAAAQSQASAGEAAKPSGAADAQSEPAAPAGQESMIPGKLYPLNCKEGEEPVIRGLLLSGNRLGGEINKKDPATEGIRCIFELSEWVEVYPDTDAQRDLAVWALKHSEDRSAYETATFSDEMAGFVQECSLEYPDGGDIAPWGSFYLHPEEVEPGYYDLVFTREGKAVAVLLTRFYNEGELENKSDAELEQLMADEIAAFGGASSSAAAPAGASGGAASSESNAGSAGASGEKKYTFPGYTENGAWPDEAGWAGMGLPELPAADAGTVTISTKDWIYPLNAKDGVMLECRPASSHFDEIVAALEDAGISGEDRSDSFDKIYAADYTHNGDPMRVTVTQYDTGKLVVLVQYQPE